MDEHEWLAQQFEAHRPHLRSVAYRMLGSAAEAEEAVQDAWVRVSRSETDAIRNVGGWLTTIVSRVCLNLLRARNVRPEVPAGGRLPDPDVRIAPPHEAADPEGDAVLADSVGLALLIVLDTLTPDERLAFVLHDMFDLPFDEIGRMLDRSPAAARQLASRARRRVRDVGLPRPDDMARQRAVVDAFFGAARRGDFDALIGVLHPDVVLREDFGRLCPPLVRRGAATVAGRAMVASLLDAEVLPVVVNGGVGAAVTVEGELFALMAFVVSDAAIVEIDILGDPDRLDRVAGHVLDHPSSPEGRPR